MFCPKCESLMYPTGNEMMCKKCGYKKKNKNNDMVIVSKRKDRENIVLEQVEVLPKTKVRCPKCGHNEAYWMLRQMRAADEPETRIYRCTKCNHSWREN
jgi:DNA-directed RNA polymerase subunit M